MEPLRELLATDQRQALEFFFTALRDVSEPDVNQDELMYNASVLAHYTLVSTTAGTDMPAPSTLAAIFDHFVVDGSAHGDSNLMETAGAQCLLLAGFFGDQMRNRHNVAWYSRLGAGFFSHAAAHQEKERKARLLTLLALHFEDWRRRQVRLSRELRDLPYLLPPTSPPSVS